MTSDLIVAGAGGARVSDGNGLKSWCGGREQLWFLGDLPSPQPSPAGGRGSKTAGEHRDQRLNSFPARGRLGWGQHTALRQTQSPPPQPSPSGGGSQYTPREAAALNKPRPSAAMARRDSPTALAVPRSAGRGAGAAAQHAALRALTRCGCLSEARKRAASSSATPRARASQVARSAAEGHGQRGRLFLWLLSFWRDKKKVTAPPGAHPGQRRILNTLPIR